MPTAGVRGLFWGVLALAALLAQGGCAAGGARRRDAELASHHIDAALRLLARRDLAGAQGELRDAIYSKRFDDLPAGTRRRALLLAFRLSSARGQPRQGYAYIARAAAMQPHNADDLRAATDAAARLGYKADEVRDLTFLVREWPARVPSFNVEFIVHAVGDASELPRGAALALLRALYEAHWKLQGGIEPSAEWRDLVLLLLERRERAEAAAVAAHVTDPYVLIAMRADRRLDSVVAANPALFDIDEAARRELAGLEAATESAPRSLVLEVAFIDALQQQRHYGASLAAADSILAALQSTNFPERLYDDLADQEPWFLESRSIALYRVGRWDEAVEQMQAASRLFEHDHGNITQLIDLGQMYCELGRPQEALMAIDGILTPASPYGLMQIAKVRLEAAVQLGDAAQAGRSLDYLRTHRGDSVATYEEALIAANHLDRAARVLAARLFDAHEREDALASVQTYAPEPEGPMEQRFDERLRVLIARKDVQSAIRRVGRIERYDLAPDYE